MNCRTFQCFEFSGTVEKIFIPHKTAMLVSATFQKMFPNFQKIFSNLYKIFSMFQKMFLTFHKIFSNFHNLLWNVKIMFSNFQKMFSDFQKNVFIISQNFFKFLQNIFKSQNLWNYQDSKISKLRIVQLLNVLNLAEHYKEYLFRIKRTCSFRRLFRQTLFLLFF